MATDIVTAFAAALAAQNLGEPQPTGTMTVRRSEITILDPVQIREKLNPTRIDDYEEKYRAGVSMPKVKAARITDHDLGKLLIFDGAHRTAAQDRIYTVDGVLQDYELTIELYVITLNEAMLLAGSVNVLNGEPLTQEERNAAIVRYLRLSKLSHSEIARRMGVHPSTVGRIAEKYLAKPAAPAAAPTAETETAADEQADQDPLKGGKIVTRGGTTYIQRPPSGRPKGSAKPPAAAAPAAEEKPAEKPAEPQSSPPPLGPGKYTAAGGSTEPLTMTGAAPHVTATSAPSMTVEEATVNTQKMIETLDWYASVDHDPAIMAAARAALTPLLRDLQARLHAHAGEQQP